MATFSDAWIEYLHCILWRLGEVDEWVFHRIVYGLSREDLVRVDNWRWFGNWPRSLELDALIGFLKMLDVVEVRDGVIRAVKPPVVDCGRIGIDWKKVDECVSEARRLFSSSQPHG